ncbi:hypothetical protein Tco_1042667 [Tanacetum coccineum]|uniref:Retrotransposon gag domain-containing protein n=1 Tax=Tanacetum coccineum TaxID=301880 RepID=A0ABQ5GLU5_9ASTR
MPPNKTTTPMTDEAIRALISKGVADALAEHEANRSRNRRRMHVARECTFTDFLKCQPLNFKGTKGVVGLTQWTVSHEVSYGMTWKALKKMMTDKYCPRGEIKKLKIELWNLKVKESDEVEKYVGGLPHMIQGSVMASKPKTMQDAMEFATELMHQKIRTFVERQAENKRKLKKKEYAGTLPLCNKCKFHHNGPCTEGPCLAESAMRSKIMLYKSGFDRKLLVNNGEVKGVGKYVLELIFLDVMDPNLSLGKICLGENVIEISSDKIEGPEIRTPSRSSMTTANGKRQMISKEYQVKLCMEHEVKRGNKVVKKELIVALKGSIHLKDKIELDGKSVKEEEEAVKRIKGEALKEKDDPGAFIFPIRLEGQVNENALVDT